MSQSTSLSVAEARASLEELRHATQGDQGFHPAPQRWINELHEVLAAIATRDAQQRYRLDGLAGINMGYLNARVCELLRDFDRLVAVNPRLTKNDA